MVFSVIKNRICFRGNTWEENLFPDNNNKVSSSGRKPEEPGSNLGHPRRPRGSQSGREKRRDESLQAWAEEPLGTILGDPGAVSRVGKGGTKVCKYGQKLSSRLFSRPDCWLPLGFLRMPGYRLSPDHFQTVKRTLAPDWAQKIALYCCAQSANNDGDGYENVF